MIFRPFSFESKYDTSLFDPLGAKTLRQTVSLWSKNMWWTHTKKPRNGKTSSPYPRGPPGPEPPLRGVGAGVPL